jgi:hypothetical protein
VQVQLVGIQAAAASYLAESLEGQDSQAEGWLPWEQLVVEDIPASAVVVVVAVGCSLAWAVLDTFDLADHSLGSLGLAVAVVVVVAEGNSLVEVGP